MEDKSKKPDVLEDPSDHDPEFQAKLLEAQKKTIQETNPGLHSVFEKYKNFHKSDTVKED